ncbi:hypothetical protein, partial [Marivita sp.]
MNGSGGSEQAGVCVVGGRFMFHFMTRRHERCQRRKPAFAHRTAGKDKLVIMQGSHRFFVDYRYDSCGLFAEGVIPKTAIGVPAAKERFVRKADLGTNRSECLHSALPVEMCMAQHLSLWGFLAFTPIDTNILTSS